MSHYLLETHCHTSIVSPCSVLKPSGLVDGYIRAGYGGVIVTDHLLKQLPAFLGRISWKSKMDRFLSGYRAVLEEGRKHGLDVFPGAEISLKLLPKNDLLVLGVTEDFFYEIPDLFRFSYRELSNAVRAAGGLLVQAHPFRRLCRPVRPALLDGAEAFNGNPNHDSRNASAVRFAETNGLLMTSGSDAHRPSEIGTGGVFLSARPSDAAGLVRQLRGGVRLKEGSSSRVPVPEGPR